MKTHGRRDSIAGWSYREQVGPDGGGRTVLAYLAATRLHSTKEWAARIERGEVEVEGTRARRHRDHSSRARPWCGTARPGTRRTVPTDFDVIHEDDAIVVVNKPSGLPTMPAGGFLDHTLLALVRERVSGGQPAASPRPLHVRPGAVRPHARRRRRSSRARGGITQ